MKDWTIEDSISMYSEYDKKTFEGIGDPVGYNVRVQAIRNIHIDVWGHGEDKEETEKIADLIVNIPDIHEQNRLLTKDLCDARSNLGRAYKGIKVESALKEKKKVENPLR